jgi:ABC-type anion transport system duplicated permease subunit
MTIQGLSAALTIPVMQGYVNEHAWVWPVCEMIHYVGMSLIIGLIGTLDLRILGLFKGLPIGSLKPFVPLAVIGFIGNLITGVIFVTGTASGAEFYIENLSFQLKGVALLLAFVNLVIFQVTGLEKAVYEVPANGDAPTVAKVIAVISIFAWIFTIFFGRLLMYNDTLLLFLGL